MRHQRATDEIRRDEIDLDDVPPDLRRKLPERRIAAGDAGIVDENVDLAALAQRCLDRARDRGFVGDVDRGGVNAACRLFNAAAASSSAAASTSHNSTAAPDASMRLAMAKPMPRAPPVTIAVRFLKSMVFISRPFRGTPRPGGGRSRAKQRVGVNTNLPLSIRFIIAHPTPRPSGATLPV